MRPHSNVKSSNDDDDGNDNNKRSRQEPHSSGRHFNREGFYENSTNLNFHTYINRSNYYSPTYHQYGPASQSYYSDQHRDLPSYHGYRADGRSYDYRYHGSDSRRYQDNRGYSTSNQSRQQPYRNPNNMDKRRHPSERECHSSSPYKHNSHHSDGNDLNKKTDNVPHSVQPSSTSISKPVDEAKSKATSISESSVVPAIIEKNTSSSSQQTKKKKKNRKMSERRKQMHRERAAKHQESLRLKNAAEKNASKVKPTEAFKGNTSLSPYVISKKKTDFKNGTKVDISTDAVSLLTKQSFHEDNVVTSWKTAFNTHEETPHCIESAIYCDSRASTSA